MKMTQSSSVVDLRITAIAFFVVCIILLPMTFAQNSDIVEIEYPENASGPFRNGDIVEVEITIRNLSNESELFYIGLTIQGPNNFMWDLEPRAILLRPSEGGKETFLWTVDARAPPGEYNLIVAVWQGMEGTLMSGLLSRRVFYQTFSVNGPPIRIVDASAFILTIFPLLAYSFHKGGKEERSPRSILFNGLACHGFAATLWNMPYKAYPLDLLFWVFVVWGYFMFLLLPMAKQIKTRKHATMVVSFRGPAALMVATLVFVYSVQNITLLLSTMVVLMVIFSSIGLLCQALRSVGRKLKWPRLDRRRFRRLTRRHRIS
jgi:hypothetical protein